MLTVFLILLVIKTSTESDIALLLGGDFDYTIDFYTNHLDNVSCILSLCSRNKFGVKAVMGRTNVGPFAFANGQGRYLDMKSVGI